MYVLLVEDDDLIRMCLAEVLSDAGMGVIEAPCAERALRLANTATGPDVLVSDVDLGRGMDGIMLAAEARRRWPLIRVVLISGVPGNLARCRLGPSDRFLPKPFSDAALLGVIDEMTAGGRREPERA